MNVIFLDFDGVINSEKWLSKFYNLRKTTTENTKFYNLEVKDPTKIDLYWANSMDYRLISKLAMALKKIPNAKVVLSTSWRDLYTTEKWNELFNNVVGWETEIIGKTPKNLDATIIPVLNLGELIHGFKATEHSRGIEVAAWLKTNSVANYAILDDFDDFLEVQADHFILTDPTIGLTDENLKALIKIFERE